MQRDPVPLTCALSMTRTRFPSRVTLRSGHLQVGIPDACLGICAPAVKILELRSTGSAILDNFKHQGWLAQPVFY